MDRRQRTEAEDKGLRTNDRGGAVGREALYSRHAFVYCPLSSVLRPLSSVFCRQSSLRLCLLSIVLCPLLVALAAAEPKALVGVVAQRFPWNGVVDVTCKVANAPKDAPLVVLANGVEVVRVAATNGEQKVSFDANKIDAMKDKKLKDVKITAQIEGVK